MTFYTYGQLNAVHLTGATRVRRGWRGRLVLQVQVKHPRGHNDRFPAPNPDAPDDPWSNGSFAFWRDAVLGDMASICPPAVRAELTGKTTAKEAI